MKKMLFAAAAVAAVFSFASAEAKGPNDVEIHNYYLNGTIQEIREDMMLTGNQWIVKNRNHKQIWKSVDDRGRNVVVKLKGNDYKSFAKVKVDGEKVFVKDIDPVNRTKHVAKILEDGERYKERNILRQDGLAVMRLR